MMQFLLHEGQDNGSLRKQCVDLCRDDAWVFEAPGGERCVISRRHQAAKKEKRVTITWQHRHHRWQHSTRTLDTSAASVMAAVSTTGQQHRSWQAPQLKRPQYQQRLSWQRFRPQNNNSLVATATATATRRPPEPPRTSQTTTAGKHSNTNARTLRWHPGLGKTQVSLNNKSD